MTADRDGMDEPLDRGFAALRASPPRPAPDFMARLTAEAVAMQPRAPARRVARQEPAPWRRAVARALAGRAAGLILAGAALAGMALGYFQPGMLDPIYEAAWADPGPTAAAPGDDPVERLLAELGS